MWTFFVKISVKSAGNQSFFFLTGTPQERPPCQGGDVIIILCSVWCCHAVLQRCLINHRHHLQVWSWTFPDHRGKEKLHGECINAVFTQHFSYDPSAQNQTGAQRYQSELGLAQVSRGIGGFSTFNFMCTTPYCLLAHGPLQINALFVTCFSQSVWDLGSILVQDKSSVRQGSGSSLVLSPCSLSGDIYTIIHVYLFC